MPQAFFGHHKCATQYVKAVLIDIADWTGNDFGICRGSAFGGSFIPEDTACPLEEHIKEPKINRGKIPELLFFPNANQWAATALAGAGTWRGFHLIRDPRDVIVSGYFSHLYSHRLNRDSAKQMQEWRTRLAAAPTIEEGLLLEFEFEAWNFANMAGWDYANPAVLELRFEEMVADPLDTFTRAAQFLGLYQPENRASAGFAALGLALGRLLRRKFRRKPARRTLLPLPVLQYILNRHAFERKSGRRRPGEEDIKHHYRKGIAGDWRNYFTPRLTAAFEERYGKLRQQLGYEK